MVEMIFWCQMVWLTSMTCVHCKHTRDQGTCKAHIWAATRRIEFSSGDMFHRPRKDIISSFSQTRILTGRERTTVAMKFRGFLEGPDGGVGSRSSGESISWMAIKPLWSASCRALDSSRERLLMVHHWSDSISVKCDSFRPWLLPFFAGGAIWGDISQSESIDVWIIIERFVGRK